MSKRILPLLFVIFSMSNMLGCVVVDDDCYYETKCRYMCDPYGNYCHAEYCWNELVCYYE